MSSHHGHHRRSNHSRSRSRHSSRRNQSNNRSLRNSSNNHNGRASNSRGNVLRDSEGNSEWSEHRSSSGKLYYYNTRTGVSQWELPAELRLRQEKQSHHHHHHHQHRDTSPRSDISESSSIRHQQDNSPSSTASSNSSSHYDMIHNDKPMLTPNLTKYFKPELIAGYTSSSFSELEQQANQFSKDTLVLSERILDKSTDLKIAKSLVQNIDTNLLALEERYSVVREAITKNDLV